MIAFSPPLLARLYISPSVPATCTGFRIEVLFHDPDMARRLHAEIGEVIADCMPLLRFGFLGREAPEQAQKIECSLESRPSGYEISVGQMSHQDGLASLFLALIQSLSTTPANAYAKLLALVDGDEEIAKEAFSPKSVEDIRQISVTFDGYGPARPFDVLPPVFAAPLAELARAIEAERPDFALQIPVDAHLPESVENGLLALQTAGVFKDRDASDDAADPEVFLADPRQLKVNCWTGSGLALAELARVLAGGRLSGVKVLNGD